MTANEALRRTRARRGWSQATLAQRLDTLSATASRWAAVGQLRPPARCAYRTAAADGALARPRGGTPPGPQHPGIGPLCAASNRGKTLAARHR